MAIFSITQRASDNELFAPNAAAGMIGKQVPVSIAGAPEGTEVTATIKDARVVDRGLAIELDLEIADPPTVRLADCWLDARGVSVASLSQAVEDEPEPGGAGGHSATTKSRP